MAQKVIIISGTRCSGKTDLLNFLKMNFGVEGISPENTARERFNKGDLTEEEIFTYETEYVFPNELIFKIIEESSVVNVPIILIELALNNKEQIDWLKEKYSSAEFYLIEVTPSKSSLKKRKKQKREELPKILEIQIEFYETKTKPLLKNPLFEIIIEIDGTGKEKIQIHQEVGKKLEGNGILKKRTNSSN